LRIKESGVERTEEQGRITQAARAVNWNRTWDNTETWMTLTCPRGTWTNRDEQKEESV